MKEIWENFKKTPRSTKFWNFVIISIIASLSIFQNIEYLYLFWVIGSITAFGLVLSGEDMEDHLWLYFIPLTWFVLLSIFLLDYVYEPISKYIRRFNLWLNKKGRSDQENSQ